MAYLTHSQTAKGASPYSKGCIFSWTNLIHPTQIEFPFGKIKFSGINKLVFNSKGHFWQYIFRACFIQIVWKQNRGAHISSTVGRDPVHFWPSLIYNPAEDAQMLFSSLAPSLLFKMSGIYPELNFTFALWQGCLLGSLILDQKEAPRSYWLWKGLVLAYPREWFSRAYGARKIKPRVKESGTKAAVFHSLSPSVAAA